MEHSIAGASYAWICWADRHEGAATWVQAVLTPAALLIAALGVVLPAYLERRRRWAEDLAIAEQAVGPLAGLQFLAMFAWENQRRVTPKYGSGTQDIKRSCDLVPVQDIYDRRLRRLLKAAFNSTTVLCPFSYEKDGLTLYSVHRFSDLAKADSLFRRIYLSNMQIQIEIELLVGRYATY